MCSEQSKDWCKWLSLAKWWYNTHIHSSLQLAPCEVVYNQSPPLQLPYLPGEAMNAEVNTSLQRRESMIKLIKYHLVKGLR